MQTLNPAVNADFGIAQNLLSNSNAGLANFANTFTNLGREFRAKQGLADLANMAKAYMGNQSSPQSLFQNLSQEPLAFPSSQENILSSLYKPNPIDEKVRKTMGSPFKLGSISSKYESDGNIADISYDSTGGTSYGKFQIASIFAFFIRK